MESVDVGRIALAVVGITAGMYVAKQVASLLKLTGYIKPVGQAGFGAVALMAAPVTAGIHPKVPEFVKFMGVGAIAGALYEAIPVITLKMGMAPTPPETLPEWYYEAEAVRAPTPYELKVPSELKEVLPTPPEEYIPEEAEIRLPIE